MPLPAIFQGRLSLPVIASPMFIVSTPELVIEQCKAGIVGTMPSLNAREADQFEPYLVRIQQELAAFAAANPGKPVPPYVINLIVHKTNLRLEHDLEVCIRQKVPLIITSLGASKTVIDKIHAYGGIVLHDVVNIRHARKAISEGVDGLIPVCAGAGGHAGALSPFAIVRELRTFYDGLIALSGAISDGAGILAAIAMGADFAYVGSRFIATQESGAKPEYKQMVVDCNAADIIYTPLFSGVHANYLRPTIVRAGLDPENLPHREKDTMTFADGNPRPKAWRDVWGCGQGIGTVTDIPTTAELVARMAAQYDEARRRICA